MPVLLLSRELLLPSGGSGLPTSDPVGQIFVPQEQSYQIAQPSNEPCIVWDPDAATWRMFYGAPNGTAGVQHATASSMEGPWAAQGQLLTGATASKPFILQDTYGNAVKLPDGKYHMYSLVGSSHPIPGILHSTASLLAGPWTTGSTVLSAGTGSQWDAYEILACSAVYDGLTTIYLYYMGGPSVADGTYSYAYRIGYATSPSSSPDATFTKYGSNPVLNPSTTSTDWDYGWLGGSQIIARPAGGYLMVYNAGDTRAVAAGGEPNTSRIGFATAPALTGPWTRDTAHNPYVVPDLNTGDKCSVNAWRGALVWNPALSYWDIAFNTGPFGNEGIIFSRGGYRVPSWLTGVDDTFNRANGAVGNSWVDVDSKYQIVSNQLSVASTGSGGHLLLRPSGENTLSQRCDVTWTCPAAFASKTFVAEAVVRVTAAPAGGNGNTHYGLAIVTNSNVYKLLMEVAGAETDFITKSISLTAGHSYKLSLSADGTYATRLVWSITDLTSSTLIASGVNYDAQSQMQSAGQAGVLSYVDPSATMVYTEVTTYHT